MIDYEVTAEATSILSPRRRSDDDPVESAHPELINKEQWPIIVITLTEQRHSRLCNSFKQNKTKKRNNKSNLPHSM